MLDLEQKKKSSQKLYVKYYLPISNSELIKGIVLVLKETQNNYLKK